MPSRSTAYINRGRQLNSSLKHMGTPCPMSHLSTIIGVNAIEEIASIGESKNISYKDLTQTLIRIKAGKVDGK